MACAAGVASRWFVVSWSVSAKGPRFGFGG
jgi:hypothetical protein